MIDDVNEMNSTQFGITEKRTSIMTTIMMSAQRIRGFLAASSAEVFYVTANTLDCFVCDTNATISPSRRPFDMLLCYSVDTQWYSVYHKYSMWLPIEECYNEDHTTASAG